MVRGRLRIPLAVVAAVAVAEAAALILRPANRLAQPAAEVSAYFSHAQIERAEAYRGPQLWLYGTTLAIEAGVIAWIALRPPRILRRALRRPVLGAAGAAAAVSVLIAIAPLPVQAVMRQRAKDVGLVTQSWPGWGRDVVVSGAIGALLAAIGGAMAIALMRRLPRSWWAPGAAIVVLFGVGTIYLGPVVVDPLFNRFEQAGPQERADVLELSRRAGVDVGKVLQVDASSRSSAANAYVTGIGKTKRVVLYDTLVHNFSRRERRVVVAHELGHVKHHDIRTGLLYLLIVAPAGMWAIALVTKRLDPGDAPGAQTIPALAAAIALVVTPIGVVSNQLSRGFEANADYEALQLTRDPDAAIEFQRQIALRNVADPDPPGWTQFLLGTHPSTMQRIAMAEEFRLTSR